MMHLGADPVERLRHVIGGDGADNLLADLGMAIGFDGTFEVDFGADDIMARLHQRRDQVVRPIVVEIFPELEE